MANVNAIIFPDENAPIHRKKSVAASVKTKRPLLGHKKPVGARRALNDITNKSGIQPKASAATKSKQIASTSALVFKDEINVAGERFLHDHTRCIKEQHNNLWDDSHLILLHHGSSVKKTNLKSDIKKDAKNTNVTYYEAEEIPSPMMTTDWLKNSTPWRSPIRHGSMMIPSTPLAWQFDSSDFKLKEDCDDLF